jgi:WD40 repeat protein
MAPPRTAAVASPPSDQWTTTSSDDAVHIDYNEYSRSSWSPHTLPIKYCHVLESFAFASYRVATGSLDRSVVIYDVHQATIVLRLSFPASIESLTCNSTQDFLNAEGPTVSIYLVTVVMGISCATANYYTAYV